MKLSVQLVLLTALVWLAEAQLDISDQDFPEINPTTEEPTTTRRVRTTTKAATTTTTKAPVTTTTTTKPSAAAGRVLGDRKPPSYCYLEKVVGPCRALQPRFFYNIYSGVCEPFGYGGCLGNDNRFGTLENCTATCVSASATTAKPLTTTTVGGLPARCYQDRDGGSASDMNLRYWYNKEINDCQGFMWSGVGGNDNRFISLDECKTVCTPTKGGAGVAGDTSDTSTGCDSCLVGRCSDVSNTPSKYLFMSSYMQIYFGLQVQCEGTVQTVKFLDKAPRAGKVFYVGIWDIYGLNSLAVDRNKGAISVNISEVSVNLVNVIKVKSNGASGWQEFDASSQKIAVSPGHYFGIHMDAVETPQADCVVPYSQQTPVMPALCVKADQKTIAPLMAQQGLPASAQTLIKSVENYQLDMRRPALMVVVKPSNNQGSEDSPL